jgi:hypothetical protein
MTRRRPAHRLTSALIGAIVAAVGVLTMALLSGRQLDTELIAIIALAAIGGWLLITAMLSGRRPRSGQWAAHNEPSAYAGSFSTVDSATAARDDGATTESHDAPLTDAARKAAAKAKRGGTDGL